MKMESNKTKRNKGNRFRQIPKYFRNEIAKNEEKRNNSNDL